MAEAQTREQCLTSVEKIIVEHLGVESEKVTEDSDFVEDLGADSLDVVELVMAFEEEFGVEISDEEAEQADTVSKVVDLILNKTGEAE